MRTFVAACAWALLCSSALAQSNKASFQFRMDADGLPPVFFSTCRGISSASDVIEVKQGNGGPTLKLPGVLSYPNVVCTRALSADNTLLDWRKLVETEQQSFRKSFTIMLLDRNLKAIKTWKFVRGWPAKWTLNELDAEKSEVTTETIEIAHEGMSVAP